MFRRTLFACALLLAPAFMNDVAAAPIVTYNLSGEPGNQVSDAASVVAPNLTASLLTRGAGLTPNAGVNSLNSAGWGNEATDFVTFGFSVNAGFQVALNNLTFTSRSSNTGPGLINVFTSLDNFTTPVATFMQVGTADLNNNIDLSGLGLITGSFSIRLVQSGNTSANGGTTGVAGTFRLGSTNTGSSTLIVFDGTVSPIPAATPVPLPGSVVIWLVGAAGAGGFWLRRRGLPLGR